jgi:hypothetical protein
MWTKENAMNQCFLMLGSSNNKTRGIWWHVIELEPTNPINFFFFGMTNPTNCWLFTQIPQKIVNCTSFISHKSFSTVLVVTDQFCVSSFLNISYGTTHNAQSFLTSYLLSEIKVWLEYYKVKSIGSY